MQKGLKIIWISCCIMIMLLCMSNLGACASPKGSDQAIRIGAPLAITGPYAGDGITCKRALEIAVEDINASGGLLGRPVELVVYDVEDMMPEKLVACAESLVVKEGCDVLICGWCGPGPDVMAFGQYDVPYINSNGSAVCKEMVASNLDEYWNVFQMTRDEALFVENRFDALKDFPYDFENKRIALIASDYAWDIHVNEALAKFGTDEGWEVVMQEVVPYGTREWRPLLSKIATEKPAYICMESCDPSDSVSFLTQFLANPTNSIIDLGWAFTVPGFLELAGEDAEGVLGFGDIGTPLFATEEVREFSERFRDKYGEDPPLSITMTGYDAAMLWAAAVTRAGDVKNYEAVCEAIREYPYDGLAGTRSFTDENWGTAVNSYLQIQNGEFTLVYLGAEKMSDFKIPPWFK